MHTQDQVRRRATWTVTVALFGWMVWSFGLTAVRALADAAPSAVDLAVEQLLDRYGLLAGRFPADTVMGYASPLDPADTGFLMRQMIARYALVPLPLDANDNHRLVLADFGSDAGLRTYVQAHEGVIRAHPDIGMAVVERPTIGR